MNAIRLSDHQLLQKAVAIHLERMNPIRVKKLAKGPWLDWRALYPVDAWVLACTVAFAVYVMGWG